MFDWHRVAICCAAAGEVSLHRAPRDRLDGSADFRQLSDRPPSRAPDRLSAPGAPRHRRSTRRTRLGLRRFTSNLPSDFGLRASLGRLPSGEESPDHEEPHALDRDLDCRRARRRGRWGVVALVRGEEISAVWLIGAALGSYAIAYRFYARFIANRVLEVDDRGPPRRAARQRHRLPADRPAGPVRPPLRRDRRRRPAGRPRARRADGLPAGHDLDRRRRHLRRRGAGHGDPVLLDAPRRQEARPDGA